jgi:Fe2+ or Zn2+ uptake regulation protein
LKTLRNTRQRTLILEILRAGRVHLSAGEVFLQARKKIPTVSLGTVYRNLNFLRHNGLAHEVRSGETGTTRYEAARDPHGHFHCRRCGKVRDIVLPEELSLGKWREEAPIVAVTSLDLHVIGDCSDCYPAG